MKYDYFKNFILFVEIFNYVQNTRIYTKINEYTKIHTRENCPNTHYIHHTRNSGENSNSSTCTVKAIDQNGLHLLIGKLLKCKNTGFKVTFCPCPRLEHSVHLGQVRLCPLSPPLGQGHWGSDTISNWQCQLIDLHLFVR